MSLGKGRLRNSSVRSGWFLADAGARCWPQPSPPWGSDSREWRWLLDYGPHDGVRHRPHFGMPLESRRISGSRGGKRFRCRNCSAIVIAQVLGGIAGCGCSTSSRVERRVSISAGGFAANGYGEHSPGGYNLIGLPRRRNWCSRLFLLVIMGATDLRAPTGFAPIAIGLALR